MKVTAPASYFVIQFSFLVLYCLPSIAQQPNCQRTLAEITNTITDVNGVQAFVHSINNLPHSPYMPQPQGRTLTKVVNINLYAHGNNTKYNHSMNILNSPKLLTNYAQRIANFCPEVGKVNFGIHATDMGVTYGVDNNGKMFKFNCIPIGMGDTRSTVNRELYWGETFCP